MARLTTLKDQSHYEAVALSPDGAQVWPSNIAADSQQYSSLGLRSVKKRLSWRDLLAVLVQLACLVAGLVIVAAKSAARYVGQINQLVALGVLLTVMGKAFQGRLSGLLLCLEVKSGARLQNLDAILRNDALFSSISLWTRLVLLTVYLVPLALSASYKQFVGGTISYDVESYEPLSFGLVSAPGSQQIGNGLGLMVNTSLPFFINPDISVAYGFNMYSFANKTMYFLDGPMPESVQHIRQGLRNNAVFDFSARVAGMVAYDAPVPQRMRKFNDTSQFQADMNTNLATYNAYNVGIYPGVFSFMAQTTNFSDLYASVWQGIDTVGLGSRAGSFGEKLRHIKIERRWCNGTWSVSKTTANLVDAACEDRSDINQRVLQMNFVAFDTFVYQINEFITQPVKQGRNNEQWVDLTVPAIGAAIWSRITALDGMADWATPKTAPDTFNASMIEYPSQLIAISVSTPALHRHWALFLILLFYPLGTFLVIVVRATSLYSIAVDQNFGLMTLLAGSSAQNPERLRGASLSGKATNPVPIRFVIEEPAESNGFFGRVAYEVGKTGQVGKIKKNVHYE